MPTVRPQASRPFVYPDTSTLIYAARGKEKGSAERPVFEALCKLSKRANVCLSFGHLQELARQPDQAPLDGDFIDTLDVVWFAQHLSVERLELRAVLRDFSSGKVSRREPPALNAFAAMFDAITPESSPGLLSVTSVGQYMRDAATDESHQRRLKQCADLGNQWAARFAADRKRAASEGLSKAELDDGLDAKMKMHLLELAQLEHQWLVQFEPERYAKVDPIAGLFRFPTNDEVASIPLLPWADPGRMPLVYCFHRVIRSAGAIAARKNGSKYFKGRGGDFWDWSHLVGAAYADGFCCDKRTAEQLGDAREVLGLRPAIVFEGDDYEALAAALLAVVNAT